jgi:hypothetical protein
MVQETTPEEDEEATTAIPADEGPGEVDLETPDDEDGDDDDLKEDNA